MITDDKFEKIVNADSWKKQLNISFTTNRYLVRIESIAYLERQTAIVAKHDHMMYKFRYFSYGSGSVCIDDNDFTIDSDTFLMISPFVPHSQVHSHSMSAEEYTIFIEISPVTKRKVFENKILYDDLDRILDSIVRTPYFIGKDKNHVGKYITKICHMLMSGDGFANISQIWADIIQVIILSAKSIDGLPQYEINRIPSTLDEQRFSILDSVFRTYHKEISQNDVAKNLGITPRHLNRIMMKYYGLTFKQKYAQSRMELATTLLKEAYSLSVDEISQKLNYSSSRYFSKCFKDFMGISPYEYRNNHKKTCK